MDVNDKLKDLRQQKKRFINKGRNADKELDKLKNNKKNKEFINNYIHKKQNAYTRVGVLNEQIDEVCESIEYHSYFDSEQIGPLIAHLVTLFEGEEYVYQSANYYSNKKDSKIECIKLIVKNDKKQKEWYDERYVNSLVKNGNAIVITKAETWYPHLDIYFYEADGLHRVNQCVSFGKFSYIKEFIDGVILYQMRNKQKLISVAELDSLELKFIKSKLEEIRKNYEVTDERRTQEFFSSVEHDKKIRERNLQKLLKK